MRNVDEILELIAEQVAVISSHIAHEPITPGSMLSPLGMDSIGRAELIERMLEILKRKLSQIVVQDTVIIKNEAGQKEKVRVETGSKRDLLLNSSYRPTDST
jgi:acyl carrier protein